MTVTNDQIPDFLEQVAIEEAQQVEAPSPRRTPRKAQNQTAALTYVFASIRIGLALLGRSAVLMASLLATEALFGWAMYTPSKLAIVDASLFAVLVFLPVLWITKGVSQ